MIALSLVVGGVNFLRLVVYPRRHRASSIALFGVLRLGVTLDVVLLFAALLMVLEVLLPQATIHRHTPAH